MTGLPVRARCGVARVRAHPAARRLLLRAAERVNVARGVRQVHHDTRRAVRVPDLLPARLTRVELRARARRLALLGARVRLFPRPALRAEVLDVDVLRARGALEELARHRLLAAEARRSVRHLVGVARHLNALSANRDLRNDCASSLSTALRDLAALLL